MDKDPSLSREELPKVYMLYCAGAGQIGGHEVNHAFQLRSGGQEVGGESWHTDAEGLIPPNSELKVSSSTGLCDDCSAGFEQYDFLCALMEQFALPS